MFCYVPLPLHCDDDPGGTGLVDLLVDLCREADGAHDSVAELLVQDGLVRIAVVLDNLVQTVDEGFDGGHGPCAPTVRETLCQLGGQALGGDIQQLGEPLDVLGRGGGLAVEQSSAGDFATAEVGGDALEAEALGRFGVEEHGRVRGQSLGHGGLEHLIQ